MNGKIFLAVGAVFGFLAVASGAFGAHALKSRLVEAGHLETWQTGVDYMMWHALALVFLGFIRKVTDNEHIRRFEFSGWCWVVGIPLFSGSLFGLSLGGPGWLGPVTPIGGLFFLCGWGNMAVLAARWR